MFVQLKETFHHSHRRQNAHRTGILKPSSHDGNMRCTKWWKFLAHSAYWMNGYSSLHDLLKALGAYLLHIRMWGCNYSYQERDGEQQRSSTALFPLPLPLCQHGSAELPRCATERSGICCIVPSSKNTILCSFSYSAAFFFR